MPSGASGRCVHTIRKSPDIKRQSGAFINIPFQVLDAGLQRETNPITQIAHLENNSALT